MVCIDRMICKANSFSQYKNDWSSGCMQCCLQTASLHEIMFRVYKFLFLLLIVQQCCLMVICTNDNMTDNIVNTEKCFRCFRLNNGEHIPVVGLGTSRIAPNDSLITQAVKDAIDAGYRHFDTAESYKNQKAIGEALAEAISSGKVKREDLFITTKVWNNQHTEELALNSVRRFLEELKLNYVDLVLVHWPMTFPSGSVPNNCINGSLQDAVDLSKQNYLLAYKGLESAVRLNLTRSIGVSNFNVTQLEKLLTNSSIKPVVNQVESHPFLSQQELLDYCTQNQIRLVAHSPLRKADSDLFGNENLMKIATKYGKTVAQVVLRWQVQRGVVVIPRSSKVTRMNENKDIFGFSLTQEEMNSIGALNRNDRLNKMEQCKNVMDYPF